VPKRIFLAHSSIDKELVRKLYRELKGRGLDPWLDEENLLPGQLWRIEIPKAIRECDFFIACLSERAIQREGYMHKEFRTALDVYAEKPFGTIYFIPLKFNECEVPDIQFPRLGINLRDIHWLDYWKPDGFERLLKVVGDGKERSDTPSEKSAYTNSLGMKFVYIPPGTFMMGSPVSEEGRYRDEFQHEVTLTKGFYMQITEVTQGQWQAVMGENPSHFKDCGDDCPVESVSWNDAQKFIEKLNRKEKGSQYRLPTEAEWEYACRAGTRTRYYTGDSEEDLDRAGWYGRNSGGKTHPVGRKEPNGFGLYDMHGNVWEWCQDWYGDYPNGSVIDPKGPSSGSSRVLRGGSWIFYGWFVRSASRFRFVPSERYHDFGLRLARGQQVGR
jgi:formylglycine-generating enzyme required for sulfatase activity